MKKNESLASAGMAQFLGEMFHGGGGDAASALAQLLGQPVRMKSTVVRIVPAAESLAPFGSRSRAVVAVRFQLVGDAAGVLFYVVPEDQHADLADLAEKELVGQRKLSIPWELTPVAEIGNILAEVYFAAVQRFCSLSIFHSVPTVAIDTVEATVDETLALLTNAGEQCIQIVNELTVQQTPLTCLTLLFLTEESHATLAEACREAQHPHGVA